MPTMVCVPCAAFFKVEKNGVAVEEGFGDGRAKPYKLWLADRYECPKCHTQVIAGFGREPVAEHYQRAYPEMRAVFGKGREVLFVDDCPGGAIQHPKSRCDYAMTRRRAVVQVLTALALVAGCKNETKLAPRFAVGDCIVVDLSRETWERGVILRVEEIGQRAYRTSIWLEGAAQWASGDGTKDFSEQSVYKRVACP